MPQKEPSERQALGIDLVSDSLDRFVMDFCICVLWYIGSLDSHTLAVTRCLICFHHGISCPVTTHVSVVVYCNDIAATYI